MTRFYFKKLKKTLVFFIPFLMSSCSPKDLRLSKFNPDEFETTHHAPLSIPQELKLPQPSQGPAPSNQHKIHQDIEKLILQTASVPGKPTKNRGTSTTEPDPHKAEKELLRKVAPAHSPKNIRKIVDEDKNQELNTSQKLQKSLIFWKEPPAPGKVIDPHKEKEELAQLSSESAPPPTPSLGNN